MIIASGKQPLSSAVIAFYSYKHSEFRNFYNIAELRKLPAPGLAFIRF